MHASIAAVIFMASALALAADGKPAARSASAPPLASTFVNPLRIGTWFKANQAFRGLVDEVKIYDYPRSAEQISGSATR